MPSRPAGETQKALSACSDSRFVGMVGGDPQSTHPGYAKAAGRRRGRRRIPASHGAAQGPWHAHARPAPALRPALPLRVCYRSATAAHLACCLQTHLVSCKYRPTWFRVNTMIMESSHPKLTPTLHAMDNGTTLDWHMHQSECALLFLFPSLSRGSTCSIPCVWLSCPPVLRRSAMMSLVCQDQMFKGCLEVPAWEACTAGGFVVMSMGVRRSWFKPGFFGGVDGVCDGGQVLL